MSQDAIAAAQDEPLSAKQLMFARELGVAMARGDRDYTKAYEAAGYAAHRGNAARLAADPRVRAIAEKACEDQLRLAGIHIGYLQAKALELLHASPTKIHRTIAAALQAGRSGQLTPQQRAEIEAELDIATWPLSEFKIDKGGIIAIKLPDKKGIIEMLCKQLGLGKEDNQANIAVTLEQLVLGSMKQKEEAA